MRERRSLEDMVNEERPVMYCLAALSLPAQIRSGFPNWKGSAQFDYRNGWTRMGDYFADGYYTREEMRELVHNRFGVNV